MTKIISFIIFLTAYSLHPIGFEETKEREEITQKTDNFSINTDLYKNSILENHLKSVLTGPIELVHIICGYLEYDFENYQITETLDIFRWDRGKTRKYLKDVNEIKILPNNRLIASTRYEIIIYNLETRKVLNIIEDTGNMLRFCTMPDETLIIATSFPNNVFVVNTFDGKIKQRTTFENLEMGVIYRLRSFGDNLCVAGEREGVNFAQIKIFDINSSPMKCLNTISCTDCDRIYTSLRCLEMDCRIDSDENAIMISRTESSWSKIFWIKLSTRLKPIVCRYQNNNFAVLCSETNAGKPKIAIISNPVFGKAKVKKENLKNKFLKYLKKFKNN